MKTAPAIVAALTLLTGSLALGQGTPAADKGQNARATADADAEKTLERIEQEIAAAAVKGDVAVFERCLADTFLLTAPDGSVSDKASLLASLKSGDLKFESSRIETMKVQVYGDAAVVTYATTDKGTYKGQDFGGRNRWTDVFILRDGRWRQVAAQGTPLSPKG